jgi:hypothetical protein
MTAEFRLLDGSYGAKKIDVETAASQQHCSDMYLGLVRVRV